MTSSRILAALLLLALPGCARGPRLVESQGRKGYVGPVEVGALARILVENSKAYGDLQAREPPFLLAVSPAVKPRKPSLLACKWREGRLQSFAYVPAAARNPDGSLDPEVDWVQPLPDFSRVEQVIRFDKSYTMSAGLVDDIEPRSGRATYHVAFLCSEGPRVALLVGYVHDALAGWGSVLVLERAEGRWRFVQTTDPWEA